MAVFDEYETLHLATMLDQLAERNPSFAVPEYVNPFSNTAAKLAEWQRLVAATLERLRQASKLSIRNAHLVTFIG